MARTTTSVLAALVGVAGLAALPACGGGGTAEEGTLAVQVHLPANTSLGDLGTQVMRVTVRGDDLNQDVVQVFAFDGGGGTVAGIPLGLQRTVTVEALDGAGDDARVLARGSSAPVQVLESQDTVADVLVAPVGQFFQAAPYSTPDLPAELTEGRVGHSVTELPDGRFLISGGALLSRDRTMVREVLRSLEVYDPRTGRTELLDAELYPGRAFHTATRLRGRQGFVLIAGGMTATTDSNDQPVLVSVPVADIFDPTAAGGGTLFQTMDMHSPRARHSATLRHDGSVLITGGVNVNDGRFSDWHAIGDRTAVLSSAEVFRISDDNAVLHGCNNDKWTFCLQTPMSQPRADHRSVRVADLVLVVGGRERNGPIDSTELFSFPAGQAAGDFMAAPFLGRPRSAPAVVRRDDESVVVVGGASVDGEGNPEVLSSIEVYDPNRQTHEFVLQGATTGSTGRRDAAAVLLPDASVLVVGGFDEAGDPLADAWRLPATDGGVGAQVKLGDMAFRRAGPAMALGETGVVLVAGGLSADGTGTTSWPTTLELFMP